MSPRQLLFGAGLGFAALVVFLFVLWSPERQVRLHEENLLTAISKKNWERVGSFIADDYSDRWGHDKAFVLTTGRQVFDQFIFLKVSMEEPSVSVTGETGTIAARLTVGGKGSPLADMVIERVSTLRQPFTFRWQQRSWKPWDWVLVRFDQEELEIPEF